MTVALVTKMADIIFLFFFFEPRIPACSFINNKDAHALILPDDICLDCQGVGYIMGNAYSPTLTTDQSAGSGSIKMYPITDEMIELVSKVIKHYRWSTFIILYDGDSGEFSNISN